MSKQQKLEHASCPTTNHTFPRRPFGQKTVVCQRFQKDWFSEINYPWIYYEESTPPPPPPTHTHTHTNFRQDIPIGKMLCRRWKGLKQTINPTTMKKLLTALLRYLRGPSKRTEDMAETLSSALAEGNSVARQALLKILSNVRFLARQALPLRDEKEGEL